MVSTNNNEGTRKSANDIVVQRSTPLGQNLILTKKLTLILKNNEERKKKEEKTTSTTTTKTKKRQFYRIMIGVLRWVVKGNFDAFSGLCRCYV